MYDFLFSISTQVGLCGVVLLLIAFFSVSTGKLSSHNIWYPLLNFSAAWLILFSLYFHWNTPSVVIELAWITISTIGMTRIILKNRKNWSI